MMLSLMRQTLRCFSLRCFSTSATCYSKSATPIPGLHIFHDFLRTNQQCELQKKVINLHKTILSGRRCNTFLSQYHNLNSDEYYRLVEVNDVPGRKIRGQHFEKYGEDGHKLTYFIGNHNIPKFLTNNLILRVLQIPEVTKISQNKLTEWNFTFNTYATSRKHNAILPGFEFHKDIESNGEATLIYSIGTPSNFQIRHPNKTDKILTIPLYHNTLVLLSEEARWDYEHKVVPVKVNADRTIFEDEVESIRRISLVLGFTRAHSRE